MNFVADEGVDAPIVQRLRADGHSILYIAEIWPGVADEQVLALAVDNQAVLITADKDFGALVFQQRRASSGVILLRLAGLTAAQKTILVSHTIAHYENEMRDSFTIITSQRVRIRPSP